MRSLILIAHNIRSTHNVGAILRTADGFGVDHVYFSGITPYPEQSQDSRLPHIRQKLTKQINKTALGSIDYVKWSYVEDLKKLIHNLKAEEYQIIGLEQADKSIKLNDYTPPNKCALLLGEEVSGISDTLLALCDDVIEIKMYGKKESFNVASAAAITLYVLRES